MSDEPLDLPDDDLVGEDSEGPVHEGNEVSRCPSCNRPLDDIAGMDEREVLEDIRINLMRDLARRLRDGTATHQEMAIAKGLLRDNRMGIDDKPPEKPKAEGEVPGLNEKNPDPWVPPRRTSRFTDEGEGG